jgi:hypothetical protein
VIRDIGTGILSLSGLDTCAGVFQEVSHAAGFLPLHSDEACLASYMISIFEANRGGFIERGICFEPDDPILDYVPEPCTDFEMIEYLLASTMGVHRKLLFLILKEAALVYRFVSHGNANDSPDVRPDYACPKRR